MAKATKKIDEVTKQQLMEDETIQEQVASEIAGFDDSEFEQITSTYHKFNEVGERVTGIFQGYGAITVKDEITGEPKSLEVAYLKTDGGKSAFAQTVILKELKAKDVELGSIVRVYYEGKKGEGAKKYDAFRIMIKK